jgi:Mce-associated membrane protein
VITLRARRSREVDEEVPAEEGTEIAQADAASEAVERRMNWRRVLVYGVLPGLALILGMTAGFMKWQYSSVQDSDLAAIESLQAAKDSTVALLSYKPDTVAGDLGQARDRTTGSFRDTYTQLTDDVVIPGSKEKQIAAAVTIPSASSVSANQNHAVVLVFVNQTITMGKEKPSESASSVRVTLDKVGDRWLVSGFDPV